MNDWKEQLLKFKETMNFDDDKCSQTIEEKWIDTHAHYDYGKFKKSELPKLLDYMHIDVASIINLGTNSKSNKSTLNLIENYDFLYGMIGFFPCDTLELELNPTNFNVLKQQLKSNKIVGVGEIGLDYHWNSVGQRGKAIKGQQARDIQMKWFLAQIDLAKEMNLPVSMHSRDAEEDTKKAFDQYEQINGVMHCFSYGKKSAEYYVNKGLYLGVGGTITYPNNIELRDAISCTPLNRIILETDAPYLSPQPVRKKINNSTYITYVIDTLSELKNTSREEIIKQTNLNAKTLFNI